MPEFYNVLDSLTDPSRCDILHVYVITNFNVNHQAFISNQVVNHLRIYPIGIVRGVISENKTSGQLKLYDQQQQDFSIKLSDQIRFETNDDIDALLRNKNIGYCFTLNRR